MTSAAFKPVWIIFVALLAVIAFSLVPKWFEEPEIIPWRTDFKSAKSEAKMSDKPVLLYFTASWCGPCQSMKHTTWANPKVKDALEDWVPVKIDVDQQPFIAESFRVQGVPMYVVLAPNGEQQDVQIGAMDANAFVNWLKKHNPTAATATP